jgi:hypothetical protein
MTDQTPAHDRLFALIASIPGSGTVDWCGRARALLDEIAAPAVPSAAAPPTQADAKAEALLLHFTAEAHRRKWSYDRGLDDDGVPIKSEAFDALHRLGEEMRTALEELRRTPAVVPSAAETTNRAALRDRIAALFRNPPGAERLGDATPGEIADAIMAVLPAPVDRAALLREAADVAREEAHRLETGNHDARAARGARSVAYLLRRLAEAPQPETQARPAAHEWFVETRMIDGYWSKYGASRDTAADGRELFERDTTGSGKAHAFRLVHATTTYAVEAEHQPDTEPQDTPPVEPHPTEADLRHALAVLDAFHGQDGDAP